MQEIPRPNEPLPPEFFNLTAEDYARKHGRLTFSGQKRNISKVVAYRRKTASKDHRNFIAFDPRRLNPRRPEGHARRDGQGESPNKRRGEASHDGKEAALRQLQKQPTSQSGVLFHNDHLNGHLDPFLSIAGPFSERDRRLLHFFLKTGLAYILGAEETPFRRIRVHDWVVGISSSPVCPHGPLIWAEALLCTLYDRNQISVLGRKVSFYNVLAGLFSEPTQRASPAQLLGMAMAGFLEHSMGNHAIGKKHAFSLRTMLDEGGGAAVTLDGCPLWMTFTLIETLHYVSTIDYVFASVQRLHTLTQVFRTTFEMLILWNQDEISAIKTVRDSSRDVSATSPPSTSPILTNSRTFCLMSYLNTRRRIFKPKTTHPLGRRLRSILVSLLQDSEREPRLFLATLFILTKTLATLHADGSLGTRFLTTLTRYILPRQTPTRTPVAELAVAPNSYPFFYAVMECAAKYIDHPSDISVAVHGSKDVGNFPRVFAGVDFLDAMELLSGESRKMVAVQLTSWLALDERRSDTDRSGGSRLSGVEDDEGGGFGKIGWEELDGLVLEIQSGWVQMRDAG